MQEIELYQQVQGLPLPRKASGMKLDPVARSIVVDWARAEGTRWQCERELATYDHSEERTWRHLDKCQFQTLLRARVSRKNCPQHGVVREIRIENRTQPGKWDGHSLPDEGWATSNGGIGCRPE